MRILYVSNAYPPAFIGGAELIAHYHAKTLRSLGHEVAVFAGDHSGSQQTDFEFGWYETVPVWRLRVTELDFNSAKTTPFLNHRAENYFSHILDVFKPDVVHCHNLMGLGTSLIFFASRLNVRVVLTVHDHWGFCLRNTFLRPDNTPCPNANECVKCQGEFQSSLSEATPIRLRRDYVAFCLNLCSLVLSPSRYLALTYNTNLANRVSRNVRVLWNGVEMAKFGLRTRNSLDSCRCSFTIISYLGEHKGVTQLLDAFLRLSRILDITLNIVGVGHLEETLRERVNSAKANDKVRFWGRVPNDRISEVLDVTDVYVLPSIWPENQPVSITEAMASGIPVIASSSGGIPELVQDGVNGLLCSPGDVESLFDAMRKLASNDQMREKMGRAGWEIISKHDFREQASLLEAQYEALSTSQGDLASPPTCVVCHGSNWHSKAIEAMRQIDSDATFSNVLFLSNCWIDTASVSTLLHWAVSDDGIESALRQASGGKKLSYLLPSESASFASHMGFKGDLYEWSNGQDVMAVIKSLIVSPTNPLAG